MKEQKLASATPQSEQKAQEVPRQGLRLNLKPLPQYHTRNTENSLRKDITRHE